MNHHVFALNAIHQPSSLTLELCPYMFPFIYTLNDRRLLAARPSLLMQNSNLQTGIEDSVEVCTCGFLHVSDDGSVQKRNHNLRVSRHSLPLFKIIIIVGLFASSKGFCIVDTMVEKKTATCTMNTTTNQQCRASLLSVWFPWLLSSNTTDAVFALLHSLLFFSFVSKIFNQKKNHQIESRRTDG